MGEYRTPGLALAITDRARLLRVFTLGVADVQSATPVARRILSEIGSIGKSMTAVALLALRDDGQFDFRTPIRSYLP